MLTFDSLPLTSLTQSTPREHPRGACDTGMVAARRWRRKPQAQPPLRVAGSCEVWSHSKTAAPRVFVSDAIRPCRGVARSACRHGGGDSRSGVGRVYARRSDPRQPARERRSPPSARRCRGSMRIATGRTFGAAAHAYSSSGPGGRAAVARRARGAAPRERARCGVLCLGARRARAHVYGYVGASPPHADELRAAHRVRSRCGRGSDCGCRGAVQARGERRRRSASIAVQLLKELE